MTATYTNVFQEKIPFSDICAEDFHHYWHGSYVLWPSGTADNKLLVVSVRLRDNGSVNLESFSHGSLPAVTRSTFYNKAVMSVPRLGWSDALNNRLVHISCAAGRGRRKGIDFSLLRVRAPVNTENIDDLLHEIHALQTTLVDIEVGSDAFQNTTGHLAGRIAAVVDISDRESQDRRHGMVDAANIQQIVNEEYRTVDEIISAGYGGAVNNDIALQNCGDYHAIYFGRLNAGRLYHKSSKTAYRSKFPEVLISHINRVVLGQ
jgi:hypothetical protein